jgi:hypothetical protein
MKLSALALSLYQKHKAINNSRFVDWVCRILISIDLLMIIGTIPDHFYPDMIIAFVLIAFWLYLLRARLIALLPLLFGLYIHLQHHF